MLLYNCLMLFRIHRMKEGARESFRWAPHTGGVAIVKPKDYEPAGDFEAANVYSVWSALKQSETPLQTGDILEDEANKLWVAKYIGFESAQWWVPEVKTPGDTESISVGIERGASAPAIVSQTNNCL
jgi:hypothetical protein